MLEARILAISLVSISSLLVKSNFALPESFSNDSQNLLSFADLREWLRKLVNSFFELDACASMILAPMLVALRINCWAITLTDKSLLFS